MGILKSKIRLMILPQLLLLLLLLLLLTTALLLLMHIITNAWYNLYISNTVLLEGDKEENVGVTGTATISLSKDFKTSCTMSRIRPGIVRSAPQWQISSKHFAPEPDLCKNVSLAVLFGNKSNSYRISTQSDMCIYTNIFFTVQRRWSGKRNNKKKDSRVRRVPRKDFRAPLWACVSQVPRSCLKETMGYCKLKQGAVDRTLWSPYFGMGYGPVS